MSGYFHCYSQWCTGQVSSDGTSRDVHPAPGSCLSQEEREDFLEWLKEINDQFSLNFAGNFASPFPHHIDAVTHVCRNWKSSRKTKPTDVSRWPNKLIILNIAINADSAQRHQHLFPTQDNAIPTPDKLHTHIKANLNILKQAKEAWEYGIFFWSKQAIGWIQHNGPDTEIFQGFLQSSGAGHDRLPSVTIPIKCFTSALYSLLAEACDSTAANPAQ